MRALHVFWTAPHRSRGIDVEAVDLLPWFERVFLALSALIWRQHSGEVTLVTDPAGAAAVARWGLADCWSRIDVDILCKAPADIDPAVFWDIGKTLALADAALPIVLLDLDLIAWKPIVPSRRVHFYHLEEIERPWYPPQEDLPRRAGYDFPDVNWSIRPANTALLYLASEGYKGRFVHESLRYAAGNIVPVQASLAAFLFSGQRLFSLVGDGDETAVSPYVPFLFRVNGPSVWLDGRASAGNPLRPEGFQAGEPITHLWSFKHELRRNDAMLETYFHAVLAHAQTLYPRLEAPLASILERNVPGAWSARFGTHWLSWSAQGPS
jgi:hypothetical protein